MPFARGFPQREAAARLVYSGAGVTCPPPCGATALTAAVVAAHGTERRRGALRSSAALRETGGVGRAGDLVRARIFCFESFLQNLCRFIFCQERLDVCARRSVFLFTWYFVHIYLMCFFVRVSQVLCGFFFVGEMGFARPFARQRVSAGRAT